MLYAIVKSVVVGCMRLLWEVRVRGVENVPRRGAVLLIANHSSVLDPPLVAGMTPRQVAFLAKAELFRVPLFGALIRRLNARPLRREGADPAALRSALRLLEEERALLVFPEGTRGEEGTLRPPKAGAGMLAVLSGAEVVPVFVAGSGRVWPRGSRLPRRGRVTVTFGQPVRFERKSGEPRKDHYEAVSREMMAAIARVRDSAGAARAAGSPAPRRAGCPEGEAGVTRA